jgi:predicted NAD/FAD-binding protein
VPRRRIAVVGSGVSGLTAAWVLQRVADVTLYEADSRLGGHAHTHDVIHGASSIAVDTGFIVHNERTYPTLLRLFAALGVTTRATEMSMSVHCAGCGLEYAGARGVRGLFPAASNLRGSYLRMLTEVPRFHRDARALLRRPIIAAEPTLGEFVAARNYSEYFRTHFLVPLVSAVWSCAPGTASDYPARYLFAFLANHGLLSVTGSPCWRTVVGGSHSYVEAVAKEMSAVATATPVRTLTRTPEGVEIRDDADTVAQFHGAVVATHPDQALRLLAAPSRAESEVLGAFAYSVNHVLLHTDPSPLPRSAAARASWNYRLADCTAEPDRVLVSYDMNRLQGLPGPQRYLVSLNDPGAIDPAKVLARMVYEHPIYTPESVAAQRRLPELSDDRVAFAGAYHGWGFHEDGAASGLRAALRLGGRW